MLSCFKSKERQRFARQENIPWENPQQESTVAYRKLLIRILAALTSMFSLKFSTVIPEPRLVVRDKAPISPLMFPLSFQENGFFCKLSICECIQREKLSLKDMIKADLSPEE